jgi:Zn-dependent M32 family carboxypeptidase
MDSGLGDRHMLSFGHGVYEQDVDREWQLVLVGMGDDHAAIEAIRARHRASIGRNAGKEERTLKPFTRQVFNDFVKLLKKSFRCHGLDPPHRGPSASHPCERRGGA